MDHPTGHIPSCGVAFHAKCELPGNDYPRCPNVCTSRAGHPGKCRCDFHAANPWAPWTGSDKTIEKGTFKDVLLRLNELGMLKYAKHLKNMGIKCPEDLLEIGTLALHERGVDWDDAVAISGRVTTAGPKEEDQEPEERREDHPLIDPKTRGNKAKAVRELSTEEGREKWRRLVRHDMYANSSVAPREAVWHTWCEAARIMGKPEMPLTYDLVIDMAAFFKAGGYRSAAQYFNRARSEHISLTNSGIPPSVLLLIPKAIRSVERDGGCDSQRWI